MKNFYKAGSSMLKHIPFRQFNQLAYLVHLYVGLVLNLILSKYTNRLSRRSVCFIRKDSSKIYAIKHLADYEEYLSSKIYEYQLALVNQQEGINIANRIKSKNKKFSKKEASVDTDLPIECNDNKMVTLLGSLQYCHKQWIKPVLSFLLIVISSFNIVLSQQKPVLKGSVLTSVDSKVISGAKVVYGETSIITDKYGRFQFPVHSQSGTIRIESMGYKDTVVNFYNTQTDLIIKLTQSVSEIEEVEVVSTGYETLPKERATGSFTHINNELFNRREGSNVLERLEGVAPGLQFDNRKNSTNINLRGINTLRESALGPLIIVDNFPYEGDIENIDPSNVASVTLLKDAAASSIWGARAANGVIVITLKQPQYLGKTSVSFQGSSSISVKPDLYYYSRMSSSEFIDTEIFLYNQGYYNAQLGVNKKFYVISPVVTLLDQAAKGIIAQDVANQKINDFRGIDYRDEMMKYIYRNGLSQRYSLNLSGSSGKYAYLMNLGYDKNDNTIVRSNNNRLNLRLANNFKFLENLELRNTISLSESNTYSGGGAIYPINPAGGKSWLYPYAKLADEFGNSLATPHTYNQEYVQTTGNGQLLDWEYRVLDDLYDVHRSQKTKHVNIGVDLSYNPIKPLKLSVQYNFENQIGAAGTLYEEDSFHMRNIVNRFSQIKGETVTRVVPLGASRVSTNTNMLSHRLRGQANFEKSFNEKHNFVAFLGAEISNKTSDLQSSQVYGYNPRTVTSVYVDVRNSYPIYDGLSGNSTVPTAENFNGDVNRFVSFYTNASYSYNKKYIFSLSARRDASNSFGEKTNSRWNPLGSTGLAYAIHEENFMQEINWIDQLKLRTTLGFSGNSGAGNVNPVITYSNSPASYTNLTFAWLTSPANPYLKWEVVRMINYGLDFSLFNRRISGSFEYFNKKASDLISNDPVDPTTGFNAVNSNVAEIRGRGFDFQLNGIISRGPFSWTSTVSLSHVRDIVSKYFGTELTTANYVTPGGKTFNPREGKGFYGIYSYRFVGLDPNDGSPIGRVNGEPSKDYTMIIRDSIDNQTYHGSGLPSYEGFWRNTMNWKGLNLSFSLAFKFGSFFRKETISYSSLYSTWQSHGDFSRRWQKPGDEKTTTVPSMAYPVVANRDAFYMYSEANIFRSDILRFQDIRMGYALNALNNKVKVNVFLTAQNLGLIWRANKASIDPDYPTLPRPTKYSLGIKADF